MSNIKTIVDIYFEAFTKKDLTTLAELYADDVTLDEWRENIFFGKDKVLTANKKLFDSAGQIDIQVTSSGITDNRSINELIISLDNAIVNVVDVLEIVDGKIKRIKAYRGF